MHYLAIHEKMKTKIAKGYNLKLQIQNVHEKRKKVIPNMVKKIPKHLT